MRGVIELDIDGMIVESKRSLSVHAMQDAIRTDTDAYNDGYKRFMPCSLHTSLMALHLKHSLNLERATPCGDGRNAWHALLYAMIGSLHLDSAPTLVQNGPR